MRKVQLVVGLLVVTCLSSCGDPPQAKELYQRALKAESGADTDVAVKLYEELLSRYPDTTVAVSAKRKLQECKRRAAERQAQKQAQQQGRTARELSIRLAENIGHVLGANVCSALAFEAKEEGEEILRAYRLVKGNEFVVVFDKEQNLFASYCARDPQVLVRNASNILKTAEDSPQGYTEFVEELGVAIFVKRLVCDKAKAGFIVVAHRPGGSD